MSFSSCQARKFIEEWNIRFQRIAGMIAFLSFANIGHAQSYSPVALLPAGASIFNQDRFDLGSKSATSRTGFYVEDRTKKSIDIAMPPGADALVTLRLALPRKAGSFWTFNSSLHFIQGDPLEISAVLFGMNGNGDVLSNRVVQTEDMKPGSRLFMNLNLSEVSTRFEKQVLQIRFKRQSIQGIDSSQQTIIRLSSPQANLKHDFLSSGDVVDFIDSDTLLQLRPEHLKQIEELYQVGHRIWVVSVRTDQIADQVLDVIRRNPELSRAQYLLSTGGFATRDFCDIEYYQNQGATTYQAAPLYRETAAQPLDVTIDTSSLIKKRTNCVRFGDLDDPRRSSLVNQLQFNLRVAQKFGDRAAGFYVMDEPASAGVPVSYLEDIYVALSTSRPDLPIVNTHSFYIGQGILADLFDGKTIREAYSLTTADIFFFDHYSAPSIRAGSISRQQRFFTFLVSSGMLSKPFVRLLGSAVNARALCDMDASAYQTAYNLTLSLRDVLPANVKSNWRNLGFWGFLNRFARSNPSSTRWQGTLAWQPQDYCAPQYSAALSVSGDYYTKR